MQRASRALKLQQQRNHYRLRGFANCTASSEISGMSWPAWCDWGFTPCYMTVVTLSGSLLTQCCVSCVCSGCCTCCSKIWLRRKQPGPMHLLFMANRRHPCAALPDAASGRFGKHTSGQHTRPCGLHCHALLCLIQVYAYVASPAAHVRGVCALL